MDLNERVKKINRPLYLIGGAALLFMMLVTVFDVIMRELGRPITGTYELVGFGAAVLIGFTIPYVTSMRGHIIVDFFTMKLPPRAQHVLRLITRIMGTFLWAFIAYELYVFGQDLARSGEVSPTLQIPFYPVCYGMAVCLIMQVVTQAADTITLLRGKS
jgi:TRAP-type C4-dicarboxylate transport system permease small subunit